MTARRRHPPPAVNLYTVISRAVEEGIAYGLTRAYKHTNTPSRDHLAIDLEQAVLNALCEVLEFPDPHA